MPYPVNTLVRTTARRSRSEPNQGSIGKIVVVMERNDGNHLYGIDFGYDLTGPANDAFRRMIGGDLHGCNGAARSGMGRNMYQCDVTQIVGLPLAGRDPIGARMDRLIGVRVRFTDQFILAGVQQRSGTIVGMSSVEGEDTALRIGIQVDGWVGGDTAGGLLHPDSQDGIRISTAISGTTIEVDLDQDTIVPGRQFTVRLDGMMRFATVIDEEQDGSHLCRINGCEGHEHGGRVPLRPGCGPEGFYVNDDIIREGAVTMTLSNLIASLDEEPAFGIGGLPRAAVTRSYTERVAQYGTVAGNLRELLERFHAEADLPAPQPEPRVIVVGTRLVLREQAGDYRPGTVGQLIGGDSPIPSMVVELRFSDGRHRTVHQRSVGFVPETLPIGSEVRVVGPLEAGYDALPVGTLARVVDGPGDTGNYAIDVDPADLAALRDDGRIGGLHTCSGMLPNHTGYFIPIANIAPRWVPPEETASVRDGEVVPRRRIPVRPLEPQGYGAPPPHPGLRFDAARMFRPESRAMPDRYPREEYIGRFARLTHRGDTHRTIGLAMGSEGRIVGVHNGHYTVDFFPHRNGHMHDGHGRGVDANSCWDIEPRHMEVIDAQATSETFAKGDRVVLKVGGGALPPPETEGVVLGTEGGSVIQVDFYPYRWKGGSQIGRGNPRSCARVMNYALRKVVVEEAVALKPFYLIAVIDKKVVPMEDQPTFDTGAEAEAHKKAIEGNYPYKIQVRKNAKPNTAWREREEGRLKDGTYKPLPKGWDLAPIADHFLHLSVKHPGQVAFTPSPEYGEQDRQVNTRPGAYVQKFYPDLDVKQVARYSALATCDGGLEIVHDGKEMARIYRLGAEGLGPESCMKYDFVGEGHGGPRTPIHPIECYAAGDLALAYLRQDGAIIARCLIWPERRLFTRGYGDLAKIYAILEAEGYERGDFTGAKLQRVTFTHGGTKYWVCPYVDQSNSVQGQPGAMGVIDDGEHLIVTPPDGGQSTNQAMGLIRIDRRYQSKYAARMKTCAHCGTAEDEEDMTPVITAIDAEYQTTLEPYCPRCAERSAFQCRGFSGLVSNRVPHVGDGEHGGSISRMGLMRIGGYIDEVVERGYYRKAAIPLADGRLVSPQTVKRHCFTCSGDGRTHAQTKRDGDRNYRSVGSRMYSLSWIEANPDAFAAAKKAQEEADRAGEEAKRKSMEQMKREAMSGSLQPGTGLFYGPTVNVGTTTTVNIDWQAMYPRPDRNGG